MLYQDSPVGVPCLEAYRYVWGSSARTPRQEGPGRIVSCACLLSGLPSLSWRSGPHSVLIIPFLPGTAHVLSEQPFWVYEGEDLDKHGDPPCDVAMAGGDSRD